MNQISFQKSDLQKVKPFMDDYLQALTGVVDDFWEEHILTAGVYAICEHKLIPNTASIG